MILQAGYGHNACDLQLALNNVLTMSTARSPKNPSENLSFTKWDNLLKVMASFAISDGCYSVL